MSNKKEIEDLSHMIASHKMNHEELKSLLENATFDVKKYLTFYVKDYEDLQFKLLEEATSALYKDTEAAASLLVELAADTKSDEVAEACYEAVADKDRILEALATNTTISTNIRDLFFKKTSSVFVQQRFLNTKKLSHETYIQAAKTLYLALYMIEHTNLGDKNFLHEHFVYSEHEDVRASFAGSKAIVHLSKPLLLQLLNEKGDTLRELAANRHLQEEYVDRLAETYDYNAATGVAENFSIKHRHVVSLMQNWNKDMIILNILSNNPTVKADWLPWENLLLHQKIQLILGNRVMDVSLVVPECFSSDIALKNVARNFFNSKPYGWRFYLTKFLTQKLGKQGFDNMPLEWLEELGANLL